MSSSYHLMCVSHFPAIVIDTGTPAGHDELVDQAVTRDGAASGHPNCQLVVGRWSGALIEVTCPGTPGHVTHKSPQTVDAGWLKLAALAPDIARSVHVPSCWSTEVVAALSAELGVGS